MDDDIKELEKLINNLSRNANGHLIMLKQDEKEIKNLILNLKKGILALDN